MNRVQALPKVVTLRLELQDVANKGIGTLLERWKLRLVNLDHATRLLGCNNLNGFGWGKGFGGSEFLSHSVLLVFSD